MAIIVILCGAPHLYKKDMNNSGFIILQVFSYGNCKNISNNKKQVRESIPNLSSVIFCY